MKYRLNLTLKLTALALGFQLAWAFSAIPGLALAKDLPVLTGTVISKSGTPKAFIRVEIDSPANTVFTSKTGIFERPLAPGGYVIKIIEGRRSNQFNVRISQGRNLTREFRLSW